MEFASKLKKAMIDKNIGSAKELSEQCDVSYYIALRLLKNDMTCSIKDLSVTARYLGVNVFSIGEG